MSKYYLPVLFALLVSAAIGICYRYPIGADVRYHLEVAETLAGGDISYFYDAYSFPYPPLLHLLLVPAVWFGIQIPFSVVLQVALLPLVVFSVSRLFKGFNRLLIGLVVLGSYAFVDRAMQVNPQALDFILLSFAIYYTAVEVNDKKFVVASALMFWNHSFVALACLGGIFVMKLYRRHWKPLAWVLLLSIPVFIVSALFLPSLLPYLQLGVYENFQEQQFWANPLIFSIFYQRLPFVGFFIIAYRLISKKLSLLESTSLATLCSISLLIIPWADRFLQYSTIPLSIIVVSMLGRLKGQKREAAQIAVFLLFLLFYLTMWVWLLADSYFIGGA